MTVDDVEVDGGLARKRWYIGLLSEVTSFEARPFSLLHQMVTSPIRCQRGSA